MSRRTTASARRETFDSLTTEREAVVEQLAQLRTLARQVAEDASIEVESQLVANASAMAEIEQRDLHGQTGWDDPAWLSWDSDVQAHTIDASTLPGEAAWLRFGSYRPEADGEFTEFAAAVPFIGANRPIVINARQAEHTSQADALLHSLVVRAATLLPGRSRFSLLDPNGDGSLLPLGRHLGQVMPSTGNPGHDLEVVLVDMQRRVETYLTDEYPSFAAIPEQFRLHEPYHIVVLARSSTSYDERVRNAIEALATTGPSVGIIVMAHLAPDCEIQLLDATIIDLDATTIDLGGIMATVVPDGEPAAIIQERILGQASAAPQVGAVLDWQGVAGLVADEWWSQSSADVLVAPVGLHGVGTPLQLWFGTDRANGRSCVHGMIAAMPGAGKSTLVHSLVCSLAVRYSPDELQMYLIDGRFGNEFRAYESLPHAAVVSMRTAPDLARNIVNELLAEALRRQALFGDAECADFTEYRRESRAGGLLPRLLVVIDDFQQLFADGRHDEASAAMLRLSHLGRSAGIHLLLVGSRFDAAGFVNGAEFLSNVHFRAALQMSHADTMVLTDFGRGGRRLIGLHCSQSGRVVVNDRGGDDDGNVAGRVAVLPAAARERLVSSLATRAGRVGHSTYRTLVFRGDSSPRMLANPSLRAVAAQGWLSADETEARARRPLSEGGLAVADWSAAERPLIGWVGQELTLRGQASMVLRRRAMENAVMVGAEAGIVVPMAVSLLATMALGASPDSLEVVVANAAVGDRPESALLTQLIGGLAAVGYSTAVALTDADIEAQLESLALRLEARRQLSADSLMAEPSVVLLFNDPDRLRALARRPDSYGYVDSPLSVTVRSLLTDGPNCGIHVLMTCASVGLLRSVLADRVVQQTVRHRVGLTMSDDDSFTLFRSGRAAALGDVAGPAVAVLGDALRSIVGLMSPYRASPTFTDELRWILDQLAIRRTSAQ